MMAYFNYLLEASICITAFYLIYHFFLQQEKLFQLNRFYLLGTLGVALIIPLINTPIPVDTPTYLHVYMLNDGLISDAVLSNQTIEPIVESWTWLDLLIGGYCIGVIVMIFRFLASCFQLKTLLNRSIKTKFPTHTLVLIDENLPAFSFFNYVFLYKNHSYSEQEKTIILNHEIAHVQGYHTLDIVLLECLKMLLWWNPIIYLYQNKLKEVHEYLADAAVIQTTCTTMQYATLMLQEAKKDMVSLIPISHSFHHQIKNRLIMLGKTKRFFNGIKSLLSVPIALVLFLAFSLNGKVFGHESKFNLKALYPSEFIEQARITATQKNDIEVIPPTIVEVEEVDIEEVKLNEIPLEEVVVQPEKIEDAQSEEVGLAETKSNTIPLNEAVAMQPNKIEETVKETTTKSTFPTPPFPEELRIAAEKAMDSPNKSSNGKCYCLISPDPNKPPIWKEEVCYFDLSPKLLMAVTNKLKAKGYPVDEELIPQEDYTARFKGRTKQSIEAYRKANNLPIGPLDFELLNSLEVPLK